MNNLNTVAAEPVTKKLQIIEITALVAATVFVQFIVHLIPSENQVPVGAILLPMFYIPLIALIFYKFHTALFVAAIGPVLNYFLTGSPKPEILPLVTFELLVFVLVLTPLLKINRICKVGALISIIAAKLASWTALSVFISSGFSTNIFINSVITAIPGIIVLVSLNILLISIKDRL
jgi:hypothetical protein